MIAEAAEQAVLGCCGSHAWAKAVAARRPLRTLPELLAASDSAWWSLGPEDWEEAFASHPRIGEKHAAGPATVASVRWSEGEQSAAMSEAEAVEILADGNRAYEAKFGRVFLVRALGRSAGEILALLRRRLHNTPEAELQESAEQQREITHLRLQRWLSEGEAAQVVPS